jgi:hypothetical protein
MDVEDQPQTEGGYEKVLLTAEDDAEAESLIIDSSEPIDDAASVNDSPAPDGDRPNFLHKTLLPDNGISIGNHPLVEGSFTIKLLKFILLTFGSIAFVHTLVAKFTDDRDRSLKLWHIWVFDGNLIVTDCVVFFLVGRLHRQRGVDHLAWILPMILCNLYFESQTFFPWLQHSLTLYQMHCIWPWQLWIFVAILVPTIGGLVLLHVRRAHQTRLLLMKLVELSICAFLFIAPLVPSPYFHLHHWFAGFLLGMHCNFNVWWSRAAMAWCWGMYINGIAVYGRDPVLTCEYAYFLSMDQHCPYVQCYVDALKEQVNHTVNNATHIIHEMVPVDWHNCSSTDYHP